MLTRRAKAYSSFCSQIPLVYFQLVRRNSFLKGAAQPKIAKRNNEKPYYWSSRSFKVIDFDTTKKLVTMGLVVIGSICMPI